MAVPSADQRLARARISCGGAELRFGPHSGHSTPSVGRLIGRQLDDAAVFRLANACAPGVPDLAALGQFHAHVLDVGLAQHEGLEHGVEDINKFDAGGSSGQHFKQHFLRQGLLFVYEIVDRSLFLRRLGIRQKEIPHSPVRRAYAS